MSISSELLTLQNTKQAIKASINAKGGNITNSTPFADYSTAIDNLPSGGSGNPLLTSIDVSDFTGTTFNKATTYITDITIPSGVTTLVDNAFKGLSITSISIPNTVTSIGDSAFSDCVNLTSVSIPNGVTQIKTQTFYRCFALTTVTIPNTVISIGTYAFNNCTHLNNISLPQNLTTIEMSAFDTCNSLTSITIPNTVTSIGGSAFNNCMYLTSVTLPNAITSLSNSLFNGCQRLASITIPNTVTSIGSNTFTGCSSLTTVTIPSGVTSIGRGAFANCTSLTSVICLATTPPTMEAIVFNSTNNCPLFVPASSLDTYKSASNWSSYASRIYPIAQVATVDGNPVYNYDLRMTSTDTITSDNMEKIPTGDSIEFAEGVTQIGGQLGAYEEVILPSTFLSFNDTQPINAATTTLTSKATTPPSVERSNLGGSGLTAVYVPAASVDTYKAHAAWGTFSSIIQAIPTE